MSFSLHTLVFRSLKRSHDVYESNYSVIEDLDTSILRKLKTITEYGLIEKSSATGNVNSKAVTLYNQGTKCELSLPFPEPKAKEFPLDVNQDKSQDKGSMQLIVPKKAKTAPKPEWHAPWKLCRVTSGHTGWVRCISFSPDNEFFITGAEDRMLKIWDFYTGKLRLTLTGHVSGVRAVKISELHPYVFSGAEDKTVKCWDLETNKVIRHYHGSTSAVYTLDTVPNMDILVTGARDGVVRVWDIRTKTCVHVLQGHRDAVASVKCRAGLPEIISGSMDATVRLWDLRAAATQAVITSHKKAVRSVFVHPCSDHFVAASADAIKQFALPEGSFVQNMRGHNTIVNAVAVNEHNVAVSGGNDGTLLFWDWKTGHNFQKLQSPPQPGSLDSENAVMGLSFDRTNQRLVTVEGDKTIKFYKQDEEATEETHPLQWRPNLVRRTLY